MSRNDITGDSLTTKPASEAYRDNWETIFGKKNEKDQDHKVGSEQDSKPTDSGETCLPTSNDQRNY